MTPALKAAVRRVCRRTMSTMASGLTPGWTTRSYITVATGDRDAGSLMESAGTQWAPSSATLSINGAELTTSAVSLRAGHSLTPLDYLT